MAFHSILFDRETDPVERETPQEPAFFADLNLDQVIDTITRKKQSYNLKPFFYTPLGDVETILYRHEIMQDLDSEKLFENMRAFADKMIVMRRYLNLIQKLDFKYHKEGWFLEAALMYCQAITGLARDLNQAELKSRGLLEFRRYVSAYAASQHFMTLIDEAQRIKAGLSTVEYCVIIKGDLVKVRRYESEIDYSQDVLQTFEKFKQGGVKDYRVKLYTSYGMSHIEAQILDFVARLNPDIFAALDQFCTQHRDFLDETIDIFDREVQFYMAYLEHITAIKKTGLQFCYPQITADSKEIYNFAGFDLALAQKLIAEGKPIVCNDFFLKDPERILIISGPNQGGKTTFARAFGQMHYLASLGCPVPGRESRLFLFDNLFTHFEKEEDIRSLRGKLQDDLLRISAILEQTTSSSIVIMNEIFNSTTLHDAVFLGKEIINRIIQLDSLCVCVTFLDELATLSDKTVSMVSTIFPDNPALRTFKIIRKPADGLAYAISIAEKHRLTYDCVLERIQP